MNLELLLSRLLILFTLVSMSWIIYSVSLLSAKQPVALKIREYPGPSKTNYQPDDAIPHSISQGQRNVKSGYVNCSQFNIQQAVALKIMQSAGSSKTNNQPCDTIPHKTSQSKKSVKSGCVNCSIIDKVVEKSSQNRKKKVQNHKKISIIDRVVERYSQKWKKKEQNYNKFRALLTSKCNGVTKALVTKANTPLGSKVVYDGERKKELQVTPDLFKLFPKDSPFGKATWDTCAVVGNGGILVNSSCGEKINSAQFVIRCNLPPLDHGYEKDVGNKTNLVTANPSIMWRKFGGLRVRQQQPYVDRLRPYKDALVPLPAFSYTSNTQVSLRAVHTLKKFKSSARPVFLNPEYLKNLGRFWNSEGVHALRLSSGLMMVSLALELCTNVDLYGFWPFSQHPYGQRQALTNHYYDNMQFNKRAHAMPAEFDQLLRLHEQGILRLHLGQCPPSDG